MFDETSFLFKDLHISSSVPILETTKYFLLLLPLTNDPLPAESDSTSVVIPSTPPHNPPTTNPIISLPLLCDVIKIYSRQSTSHHNWYRYPPLNHLPHLIQ
jgi:hypothetical protein